MRLHFPSAFSIIDVWKNITHTACAGQPNSAIGLAGRYTITVSFTVGAIGTSFGWKHHTLVVLSDICIPAFQFPYILKENRIRDRKLAKCPLLFTEIKP
jgi:hypothetical protein